MTMAMGCLSFLKLKNLRCNVVMGCWIVHITCLLSAALSVYAWQPPKLQIQPITAARSTTILKAAHHSQLLEFFQKKNKDTINSVEDFDQDLAAEIEDALLSAGFTEKLSSVAVSPQDEQPTISAVASVSEFTSSDESQEYSAKQILHAPVQIKALKIDTTPPHTSLAQVMANQLNIDLSCVTPSNTKKITASDVEYHAWKMSQPPCTPEALARAHQLGLDLNALYDDDDREYVMQLSDVRLYEENSRSLRLVSQKRRGASKTNDNSKTKQRMKKLSAIDERMEKRMGILAKKLGNVAGGIAKTVILQTSDVALVNIEKKVEPEFKSVEDFDPALAMEIQQALMSADIGNETNSHQIGSAESLQVEDVVGDVDAGPIPDIESVQEFDATLAFEIQDAITDSNSENNSHAQSFEADKQAQQQIYDIESGVNDEHGTLQSATDIDADTQAELQTIHKSMTVAQIKEQLRAHGVKSCGKKSELAQRLHTLKTLQSMTVEQLKQGLREQGLKVGGKKADLVERLIYAKENEKKTDGSLFFVDMQ